MKLVAIMLAAALALGGGMSLAFAECAGHTKAQMVKSGDAQPTADQQISSDATAATPAKGKVAQKVANLDGGAERVDVKR